MIKLLMKIFEHIDNAPTESKIILSIAYLLAMIAVIIGIALVLLVIFPEPLNKLIAVAYLFAVGYIVAQAGNDYWGQ